MSADTDTPSTNILDPSLKKIPTSKLPPTSIIWPWPAEEIPHSSEDVHISSIPYNQNIRTFSLQAIKSSSNTPSSLLPPPLISASEFIPPPLITHLMRNKRGSALAAKFVDGAEITNMEGVMHTFVVPVVPRCETAGDYCFSFGHRVTPPIAATEKGEHVGEGTKVLMTRSVVMSASIHMDFESSDVMMELCRLRGREVVGRDLNDDAESEWSVLGKEEKQDDEKREEYDESLRRHLVFHLMRERKLPAVGKKWNKVFSLEKALAFLSELISSSTSTPDTIQEKLVNQHVKINSRTLSLEILFATAFHLVRNEFSALEALCTQGYLYTYDPASIFAGAVGAELLNRLWILALKVLAGSNELKNLRIFGFNNYADKPALDLVKTALDNQKHVFVVSKGELFQGTDGRYERGRWITGEGRGDGGRYDVKKWEGANGAMLVIHNNSDAFGQNVETEGMSGSLDGAIGASSSAAGSLERRRKDLLDWVV
ncbi:hypothetical protein ONS95_014168 [Cadophora gregata]|uniref:uncharacterized protein n=1 Tax=Cadophora gregata TaxID=51156 RepID=UPI0026DBF692|nr:uncharacterized protein ONS95_014168 [Cadophora gregata]KAK0114683.1 hypothetical protein ONS95_014168 [Cadophora gregata]